MQKLKEMHQKEIEEMDQKLNETSLKFQNESELVKEKVKEGDLKILNLQEELEEIIKKADSDKSEVAAK